MTVQEAIQAPRRRVMSGTTVKMEDHVPDMSLVASLRCVGILWRGLGCGGASLTETSWRDIVRLANDESGLDWL